MLILVHIPLPKQFCRFVFFSSTHFFLHVLVEVALVRKMMTNPWLNSLNFNNFFLDEQILLIIYFKKRFHFICEFNIWFSEISLKIDPTNEIKYLYEGTKKEIIIEKIFFLYVVKNTELNLSSHGCVIILPSIATTVSTNLSKPTIEKSPKPTNGKFLHMKSVDAL